MASCNYVRHEESSLESNKKAVVRELAAGFLGGLLGLSRSTAFGMAYAKISGAAPGPILVSFFLSGLMAQLIYIWRRHPLPGITAGPCSCVVPFMISLAKVMSTGAENAHSCAMRVLLGTSTVSVLHGIVCSLSTLGAKQLDVLKATLPQPLIFGLFASLGYSLTIDGVAVSKPIPTLASGIGLRLIMLTRAGKNPLVFPTLIFMQVAIFHASVAIAGLTIQDVRENGYLFETFDPTSLPEFFISWLSTLGFDENAGTSTGSGLTFDELSQLAPDILPIVMSALPIMLMDVLVGCVLPLEVLTKRSLPCDKDLGRAATSAMVCGFLGGQSSYVTLTPTKLTLDAGGGESVFAGWAAVAVWAVALTPLGPRAVGLCPSFVVGGLLVYIAVGFLIDGFIAPRRLLKHAPTEYMVLCLTFAVAVWKGLPPAMLCGISLLSLLFVVRYSRGAQTIQLAQAAGGELQVGIVTGETGCGTLLHSRKYRSENNKAFLLPELAKKVFVVRTNVSHLFFASITPILASAPLLPPLRYLVLDLTSVHTLDSSALAVLEAIPPGIMLLITGLKPELHEQASALGSHLRNFSMLEDALEWCEEQLLMDLQYSSPLTSLTQPERHLIDTSVPRSITMDSALKLLSKSFASASSELLVALIGRVGERRRLSLGAVAFEEGHPATAMVICLSGSLGVYQGSVHMPMVIHQKIGMDVGVKREFGAHHGHEGRRVRGMGPGDVLFEAALRGPCIHAVTGIVESPCELLSISRQALLRIEASEKPLAFEFYKALAWRLLSLRDDADVNYADSDNGLRLRSNSDNIVDSLNF